MASIDAYPNSGAGEDDFVMVGESASEGDQSPQAGYIVVHRPVPDLIQEWNITQFDYKNLEAEVNRFMKEDEFIQLLLTIEGEKLSKELFSFLFDLVSAARTF